MRLFGRLIRWRTPLVGAAALAVVGIASRAGVTIHLLQVTDAHLRASLLASRQDEAARQQLRLVLAAFDAARSAERGYLLTDDADLLAPMRLAQQQLDMALATLGANPRWSSAGRDAFATLRDIVHDQMAQLDRALALHDSGQRAAAAVVVRTNGSNALGERMGSLVAAMTDDMIARTDADTTEYQHEEQNALTLAVGGTVFGTLVLLAAGVVVVVQTRAHNKGVAELVALRDAAQASNRAKSRFLAAVSHDLRQPLHAITLLVAALRRRSEGAEAEAIVDNIGVATGAMQRMFAALLDVARLDAGAVVVEPRSFHLDEVLRALRTRFTPMAQAKGITLEIPDSRLFLWTDPALLESVLNNLLANAVAYTVHGGVTVTARRQDQVLEIDVRDTGPGIAADRLERIFEEFVHLDYTDQSGTDPSGRSVGLGLAIVRLLADLLGARVTVQSNPGIGSVFAVRMPFVAGELETTSSAPAEPPASLAGLCILVLEDDPLVLQATAIEVRDWGATPVAVRSAGEAMAAMERMAPATPDGAIVDQDIAGEVSGVALLDHIAARFGVALPSVILTGMTSVGMREELTDSGHTWLLKPADADALRRTLAHVIATARHSPLAQAPLDG